MKIENIEISNLEAALRGMRNPMNSWGKSTPSADIELGRKLSAAGPTHGKFLRMITITCDITAPLYWWKEFDTYKVGTVANSCSTMHTVMNKEFTMEDFEVSTDSLINSTYYEQIISMLNDLRKHYLECEQLRFVETMKVYWEAIVSLLPSGYLQKRTVMLNYEVMRRIVKDRTGHKLREWRAFINTMERELPFYDQFILGEPLIKNIDTDEGEEEHMETRETAQNKEEAKADSGKAKLSLVPRQIIFDIAKVREFGTKKYGGPGYENWRHVEVQRYRDAAFRHFMAYLDDPYGVDGESGLSHLSHLACNIAFLCEMEHVDKTVWTTTHNKEALRKAESAERLSSKIVADKETINMEAIIIDENKKRTIDIIRNAVRKYWTEESQHPESVVVYFYQKYDFDSDDKWVLHAEYVMPHSSDDFSTVIFEHDFCKGQSDVKDINIVSAEKVFDFYYYAMFHWKGL